MVALYFVFIFLLLFYLYTRRYKMWIISSYLISIYLFSVIISLIVHDSISIIDYISPFSGIVFCFFFFFIFSPFTKKEPQIVGFKNQKQCDAFIKIGSLLSLILIIGMILQISLVSQAFVYGLGNIRDDMYDDYSTLRELNIFQSIGQGLVGYLKGVSFTFVLFFFYSIAFIKKHTLFKILLIIASLSGAYSGILIGGRTQTMYWLLYTIFAFLLFRKYIPQKGKSLLYIALGTITGAIISYFIIMSFLRVEFSDTSTSEFLTDYAGQIIPNFCNYVDNFYLSEFTLARIFPNIDFIFNGPFDLALHNEKNYMATGLTTFYFTTFVGDLMEDIGWGVILYIICFYIFANKITGKKIYSLPDLIYLGLIYQIPLHGLFYNSLGNRWATLGVFFSILIARYLESKNIVKKRSF